MESHTKDSVKLKDDEKLVQNYFANRLYNNWENNKEVAKISGS